MKKVFRGANSINLDSKGRIAVPAKYRPVISESSNSHLIITCDPYDTCLLIFTLEDWENTEADLQALSNKKRNHRRLKRIMLSHATEVDMDANGRLLIPSVLRERAGLVKEVMLTGNGKTFQLWDKGRWDRLAEEDMAVLTDEELNSDDLPDLYF
ncbi:MAG: cell division/cell wall cluster transcriptional repressor MraZ [Kangiella sp.]|nr:MAG: cell division/cell wall cluster transcriptional repressor MraZ [Kangiella sp.]